MTEHITVCDQTRDLLIQLMAILDTLCIEVKESPGHAAQDANNPKITICLHLYSHKGNTAMQKLASCLIIEAPTICGATTPMASPGVTICATSQLISHGLRVVPGPESTPPV